MVILKLRGFTFLAILFALIVTIKAGNLQRKKRDVTTILQDLAKDIENLKERTDTNKENLRDVQSFLAAIGFGQSTNRKACGGENWLQLNPLTCVTMLEGLYTFDGASDACSSLFVKGTDLKNPRVLTITSQRKQEVVKKLLLSSSITSVWIDRATGNYSNWATGSPTAMNCTEIQNRRGQRGQWIDMDCGRTSNVICEKDVYLSYAQLVNQHIQLKMDYDGTNATVPCEGLLRSVQKHQDEMDKQQKDTQKQLQEQQDEMIKQRSNIQSQHQDLVSQQMQLGKQQKRITELENKLNCVTIGCDLNAVVAASFPRSLNGASVFYDDNDFIYIFGGWQRSEIYRFNIRSTEVLKIGNLPANVSGGVVVRGSSENVLYLGGKTTNTVFNHKIFQFGLTQSAVKEVGSFEENHAYGGSANVPGNSSVILLTGGFYSDKQYIRGIDTSTLKTWRSGVLRQFYGATATFENEKNAVIIANGHSSVEILNLETLTSTEKNTTLPLFAGIPSVITDGTFGYILGGYDESANSPIDAIIRFDPISLKHEFVPVKNFPFENSTKFSHTSTVYVKKLNRIYIIGGYSYNPNREHDKIWYIDISSLPPYIVRAA